MDGTGFFGLRPVGDRSFELPVTMELCSGLHTLFGGSALGAAAEVLAEVTGRPPVWLGGQFLSFARPGDVLRLEVEVLAEGRRFTQARLVGRGPDGDVFHVAATLGAGGVDLAATHVVAPTVDPAAASPPRSVPDHMRGTMLERMDVRLARSQTRPDLEAGTVGPGQSAYWARLSGLGGAPSALAILGDLIPLGVVQSVGRRGIGSSLDHSLRIHRIDAADWLLVDVRVQAIEGGVAHALAHLFDERGVLRGTASQTTAVRLRPS